MKYKLLKIRTFSATVAILFTCCKENNSATENNKLQHEWVVGQQEYLSSDMGDSMSVIVDTLEWKEQAEQYLAAKDGDTLIIEERKRKATKMVKSDNKTFDFDVPTSNQKRYTKTNSK